LEVVVIEFEDGTVFDHCFCYMFGDSCSRSDCSSKWSARVMSIQSEIDLADLSAATGSTINAFREAVTIQQVYEKEDLQ
jgi:hypothetical protein